MRDRRPQQEVTQQAIKRVERILRKAGKALRDSGGDGTNKEPLTEWEAEFLASLKERLETFGSAFADPNLGAEEEALSIMQNAKLFEVSRSVRRKVRTETEEKSATRSERKPNKDLKRKGLAKRSSLKRKTPLRRRAKISGSGQSGSSANNRD